MDPQYTYVRMPRVLSPSRAVDTLNPGNERGLIPNTRIRTQVRTYVRTYVSIGDTRCSTFSVHAAPLSPPRLRKIIKRPRGASPCRPRHPSQDDAALALWRETCCATAALAFNTTRGRLHAKRHLLEEVPQAAPKFHQVRRFDSLLARRR